MIFSAEDRQPGWFRDRIYDVCVCGAGPAGITVARKLAAKGWSVALMEAGGLEFSAEAQNFYMGANVGLPYYDLHTTRLRYFGGTSNVWGGWCRALDPHDFASVSHHPLSGWPIGKADLDRYAGETDQILGLAPGPVCNGNPESVVHAASRVLEYEPNTLAETTFRWSAPTRFGVKYRKEFETSSRIYLFLHANLVDITLHPNLQAVARAVFRSYKRSEPFTVHARFFVLCLGGLENPRSLLNATRQVAVGIGNQHGLVGRYFAEHPEFKLGYLLLKQSAERRFFVVPTPRFMLANQVLNFNLRVSFEKGTTAKKATTGRIKAFAKDVICQSEFMERLVDVVRAQQLNCRGSTVNPYDGTVEIASEQALNPGSRVMLDDEVDGFGLRRIKLDWRLSEIDYRTMRVAVVEFGRQLAAMDVGRVRVVDWLLDTNPRLPGVGSDQVGGFHHMCTTRMSNDPKQGVVDRDCKIHGIANLYIGGSSVFATAGHANPTYTIVQLALRLCDRLHRRLSTGSSSIRSAAAVAGGPFH